jgi:hypothetical protein
MRKIFLLLFLVLFSDFALSLGISPPNYEIFLNSGSKTELKYTAINNDGYDYNAKVLFDGDLKELFKINENDFLLESGKNHDFLVEVSVPNYRERRDKFWEFETRVILMQSLLKNNNPSGLLALIAVASPVRLIIPCLGKCIGLRLAGNISKLKKLQNVEKIDFSLEISNRGREAVFVEPKIEIFRGWKKLTEIKEKNLKLDYKEKKKLKLEWNFERKGLKSGKYRIRVLVGMDNGKFINEVQEFEI